jgi:hypothetical protein
VEARVRVGVGKGEITTAQVCLHVCLYVCYAIVGPVQKCANKPMSLPLPISTQL